MGIATIRPSADLRNHYNDISKICHETRETVVITVNGREDTVVLSFHEYQQMKAELDLLRTLAEAEEDVTAGRVAPMKESFIALKASICEEHKK
jgi:prevent-host-death family protein